MRILWYWLYFFLLKLLSLLVASVMVAAIWYWSSQFLLGWYDWNTARLSETWDLISPLLPNAIWAAVEGLQKAYAGFVVVLRAMTSLIDDPFEAQRMEAAVRGVLGEGWLVLVETAILFRIGWGIFVGIKGLFRPT